MGSLVDTNWVSGLLGGQLPAAFAADVIVALPAAGQNESGPRRTVRGRTAAVAVLTTDQRDARGWEVVVAARGGDQSMFELIELTAEGPHSVGLVLGMAGEIVTSVVMFRHSHVGFPLPPATPDSPVSVASADELVRRYLRYLEAGEVGHAVACFSPAGSYSVPPRSALSPRVEAQGRPSIERVFTERGVNAARHQIEQILPGDRGNDSMVFGRVTGLPEGNSATFLSCLHVGPDGLIARYVAQMCVPEAFAVATL
jgi:hypothetical protein